MVVRDAPVISQQVHDDVEPVRVEVVEHLDVTPRMRRVRFAGDVAALPADGPTDHAKIFFPTMPGVEPERPEIGPRGLLAPLPGRSRPYREYTLRSDGRRRGRGRLRATRLGARRARGWRTRPGRSGSTARAPRSVADPRDWYLLGGDETALPALTRWLARLPATASATVFVEVADAAEEQELPSSAAVRRPLAAPRTAPSRARTTLLGDAVDAWSRPEGEGLVWMGAEASALRPVRRQLRDLLPTEWIDLDGYWRRGVEGTGLG